MSIRTTLSHVARQAQMMLSRASIREIDDKHLMQQIKTADIHHSETATDFERWQMVGLTAVPLKQEQQNQNSKVKNTSEQGDWNHDQPKGKSAEALMLYVGGSRSHPVGIVDDRRVRPYAMKEGESAMYAASGTGQMLFHDDNGSYLVAVNNPPEQSQDNKDKERYASLRHVKKDKQSREIKEGQDIPDPKHQGKTVNTEVRTTSTQIQILDADQIVAVYDKNAKSWTFQNFKKLVINASDEIDITSKKITITATDDILDLKGKPIKFNDGTPTSPPFQVPG